MSDVRPTDDGIAPGAAREESVADAVAALQLILLAFVAELEERGAIDSQMLAHRLKGTFPEDAEDSVVKGLIEVFGRRLVTPERRAETESPNTTADGERCDDAQAVTFPTTMFQAYSLIDRDAAE